LMLMRIQKPDSSPKYLNSVAILIKPKVITKAEYQ
jgi:hypothetical protein